MRVAKKQSNAGFRACRKLKEVEVEIAGTDSQGETRPNSRPGEGRQDREGPGQGPNAQKIVAETQACASVLHEAGCAGRKRQNHGA